MGILSAVIGAHYGMDEYELRILTTAALLHDIGKKFLEIDIFYLLELVKLLKGN